MAVLPALHFETDGLYILLSDRGEDSYGSFHWSLFLAKSNTTGTMFHLINATLIDSIRAASASSWRYETKSSIASQSRRLLLALKVGVLEPVLQDAVGDRLAQVPIEEYSTRFGEDVTCRVWLKEALFALNDEGYVTLTKSIDGIENEARFLAIRNQSNRRRTIVYSGSTGMS